MRAVVPCAQLTTAIHKGRHLLIGDSPQDFVPQLRVGDRFVEHQLAHDFENLDGASLGLFAGAQQVIAPLPGLGVDAGDELVLHFHDGVGGFS